MRHPVQDSQASIRRRQCLIWAAAGLVTPGSGALAFGSPDSIDDSHENLRPDISKAIDQGVAQAPLTHAVVVEQRRRIVGEAYFTADDKPSGAWFARTIAFNPETLHDMRSVSKSVVALLVGIAHGQGRLDRERPVMDWFPEHATLATRERRAMRLEHLQTMTAGFEWDESSVSYANLGNSETRLGLSADPVGYVLSRDMVAAPGTRFAYSGGATLLLAEIVERATGRSIDEYARSVLFEPLSIQRFEWRRHPLWDKPLPYSGLRLTPRSMVRLGRLVLDGGRHGDEALVPAGWLAELQRPWATDTSQGLRYGWQWWVGRIAEGPATGMDWVAGLGNGGQVLMIVPALDATIAVTAGRYNSPASGRASLAICRRVIEAMVR
jgi:CubicO group peptidase (beta-lactamase class C family)